MTGMWEGRMRGLCERDAGRKMRGAGGGGGGTVGFSCCQDGDEGRGLGGSGVGRRGEMMTGLQGGGGGGGRGRHDS